VSRLGTETIINEWGHSNGGTRIHTLDDFTSSAVATGAVAAFFFGGLSYDVTFGVRKRFICEDSWDARSSRAFPGVHDRGILLLFSLLLLL
jgi:hypothetical protein